MRRTPAEQRQRDQTIPRPPAGMQPVPPADWIRVWHQVRAKPPIKVIGYVLCTRYADHEDGADIYPGTEQLATVTQQSERVVIHGLRQIREWHLIWRYVEGSRQGRRQLADAYRLAIPDDLRARVPLIPALAGSPDQVTQDQVIPADHLTEDHLISGDQVTLTTGSGDSDDTDQVTLGHPTSPDTSPGTSLSSVERAALRLLDHGGTEREIRAVVDKLGADPRVRYVGAYLRAAIARGDGPVLLAEARQELDTADRLDRLDRLGEMRPDAPAASTWCEQCDQRTRLVELDDGRVARCPVCHPMRTAS